MFISAALALAAAADVGSSDASPATSSATAELRIEVTDLRNRRGELRLGVFRQADGFPESRESAVVWESVSAGAAETSFALALPPGEYAVVVLHDENANKKLDRSWGVPREGYGVTNNPKPRLRAATYAEAKIDLPAEGTARTISIQYF